MSIRDRGADDALSAPASRAVVTEANTLVLEMFNLWDRLELHLYVISRAAPHPDWAGCTQCWMDICERIEPCERAVRAAKPHLNVGGGVVSIGPVEQANYHEVAVSYVRPLIHHLNVLGTEPFQAVSLRLMGFTAPLPSANASGVVPGEECPEPSDLEILAQGFRDTGGGMLEALNSSPLHLFLMERPRIRSHVEAECRDALARLGPPGPPQPPSPVTPSPEQQERRGRPADPLKPTIEARIYQLRAAEVAWIKIRETIKTEFGKDYEVRTLQRYYHNEQARRR